MTDLVDVKLDFEEAHLAVYALEFYTAKKSHLKEFPSIADKTAEKIRKAIVEAFRVKAERKAVSDA